MVSHCEEESIIECEEWRTLCGERCCIAGSVADFVRAATDMLVGGTPLYLVVCVGVRHCTGGSNVAFASAGHYKTR